MRRLKTVRRPPIYPKTPGHLPCSSLTHPLPLSSRRPSVSFGGFGLRVSGIAHDINHMLTSILLRAELLAERVDSEEVKEEVAIIRQTALDAAASVQRMQEPPGISRGFRFQKLAVNHLVKAALQMVEPFRRQGRYANASTWSLEVNLEEVEPIIGNEGELREALINLILNAVDALPSQEGLVEIATGSVDQWAIISVRDNGAGIPLEIKNRIFDPAFTTKGAPSRGMGLSITRQIVASHGGRIELESEVDIGSLFTIYLPLARPGTEGLQ